jgi:2-polyprenyl-3-methyl-5-hydroxy-6-metoxy-1,4-benzoquinol methylase
MMSLGASVRPPATISRMERETSESDVRWTDHLAHTKQQHATLLGFALNWWHYNMPMLARVQQAVPSPARVLEVGTGTGALTVLLAANGYSAVGIDIDAGVVSEARRFAEHFRTDCRFEVADGFDLTQFHGQFDLAFSAGVIEHFSHERAVAMIREQARVATYVLAVVPTWYALRNDPATEPTHARAIRRRELREIFRDAGLIITKQFGYGTPDTRFEPMLQLFLPPIARLYLENRRDYAATIGCIGASRTSRTV